MKKWISGLLIGLALLTFGMARDANAQAARFYSPNQQFLNASGVPYAGGLLYFYASGTSTPLTTYNNSTLTVANPNPVVLDANGQAGSIFLQALPYKVVLADVNNNQIWTEDPVLLSVGSSFYFGASVSTGSANAQVLAAVNPSNFALGLGATVNWIAGFTNTSSLTLNIASTGVMNVYKRTPLGLTPLTGGEVVINEAQTVFYDGTQYELMNQAYPNFVTEATLASNTTTDLGTIPGSNVIAISGTTTITSFGSTATTANPIYFLRFTGAMSLTYNATSLILPGGVSITTVAGDAAIAKYEGSGNWRIVSYTRASGTSPAPAIPGGITGLLPSSITGTASTGSLTLGAGSATDSTGATTITVNSPLSVAVANGNAINGISGGGNLSATNAGFHVYLCAGASGVGAMISGVWPFNTSLCPAGYNSYGRRAASIATLSTGQPLSGVALETEGGSLTFFHNNVQTDASSASVPSTGALFTVSVPHGLGFRYVGRFQFTSGSNGANLLTPGEPVVAPSTSANPGVDTSNQSGLTETFTSGFAITNSSGQVQAISVSTSSAGNLFTKGYVDFRRN